MERRLSLLATGEYDCRFLADSCSFVNYDLVPEEIEVEHTAVTLDILKKLSPHGQYPAGVFVERPSISTPNVVKKVFSDVKAELLYDSSSFGDDLPYYGGDGTLMIPHTLDCE